MSARFTLAATLVIAVAGASEASAFELKHSGDGQLVRWRRASVEWTVDRSVREVVGARAAIETAVDAWTQRGGAPTLVAGAADASVRPGLDGKNVVFYARDGFEPAGAALAVTLLSFDERTGEVLDADIVLNGKYHLAPVDADAPLAPLANGLDEAVYDVGRVVAHEMGHALGLSDELVNHDALMYPFVPRSRALATSPGADDLAGLARLYGATTRSTSTDASAGASAGCTGAVVARSGPGSVSVPTFVAGGLVIAALAIARGRGHRRERRGAAGFTVMAAAALVTIPAGGRPTTATPTDFDASAVVTRVTTSSVDGVFRSEVELTTTACASGVCPAVSRATVWGGTVGGVRQVVGGLVVPGEGDRMAVVLDSSRSGVRAMARVGEYEDVDGR